MMVKLFFLTFLIFSFGCAEGTELHDIPDSRGNDSAFADIKEILILVSNYVKEKNLGVLDINPGLIEKSNDTLYWYPWPNRNGWSIFYWGDSVHAYNTYPARAPSGREIRIDIMKKGTKFIIKNDRISIIHFRR